MTTEILTANLSALANIQPVLADRIQRAAPDSRISPAVSRDGTPILTLRNGQSERMLHSGYAPQRESARRLSGTEDAATLVLLGAGAMIDTRFALDRRRAQSVVVGDLGPAVWRSILEVVAIDDLLFTGRLYIADEEKTLERAIHTVHHAAIRDGIVLRRLQSWTDMPEHRDDFNNLHASVQRTIEAQADDLASYRRFGKRWFFHIFRNTLVDTHQDRFSELTERLAGRSVTILGAGPTAEDCLSEYNGNPIVAVDTAYPMLLRSGVKPAAVVSVDAHAWSALHLRRPLDRSTILIADPGISPRLIDPRAGLVYISGGHPLLTVLGEARPGVHRLPSPYSTVTEAAIQISRAAGASAIHLLGVDFGYPRAKTYARGTYHYDVFTRRAKRVMPQESQFGRFVYERAMSSAGALPFFPLPDAESIRRRLGDLIHTKYDFADEVSPVPSRFAGCPAWIDHVEHLRRAVERLEDVQDGATPDILAAAGAHARAHIPFHAAVRKRFAPDLSGGAAFIQSIRWIQTIVAAQMSRYC